MKNKVILKAIINLFYLLIGLLVLEVLGNLPLVKNIWLLNTGSVLDLVINVIGSIIAFVLLILWAKHLIENLKCYSIKTKSKDKGLKYCSVFNPFC